MGLASDGRYLYLNPFGAGKIYKMDPENGGVVSYVEPEAGFLPSLAWRENYLWAGSVHKIYKIDPETGDTVASFEFPIGEATGFAGQTASMGQVI